MNKKGHIILGFIVSFIFIYLTIYFGLKLFDLGVYSIIAMAIIIPLYSILPDIDHKGSWITHLFFGIGIAGLCFGLLGNFLKITLFNPYFLIIFSTLFLVFVYAASNFLEHRGLVHTVWVGLLSASPMFIIFNDISYFIVAYVAWHSHLFGDGFLFKLK